MTTFRRAGAFTVLMLLLLSGCRDAIGPLEPEPYMGDWRLSVSSSSCWQEMDIVFNIRPTRVQRWSEFSVNFDSQWAFASEPSPFRLITGIISQYENDDAPRISLTLFSLGEVLGMFDGPGAADEMNRSGIFYSINGPRCQSNAVLTGPG